MSARPGKIKNFRGLHNGAAALSQEGAACDSFISKTDRDLSADCKATGNCLMTACITLRYAARGPDIASPLTFPKNVLQRQDKTRAAHGSAFLIAIRIDCCDESMPAFATARFGMD